MTIKHLVLGGGAYNGLNIVGALFQMVKAQFFHIDHIQSIYATSAGTVAAVLLLLDFEEETLCNYFIHRPWHKILPITPNMVINMFDKKGLLDSTFLKELFLTLFKTKDIDPSITLLQFYQKNRVELVMCATKSSTMSTILFSYKHTPDVPLLDAVYMSSSIPVVFQPCFFENDYIIDGGIVMHDPIKLCIENGAIQDEILNIKIKREAHNFSEKNLNIFLYSFKLFNNLSKKCNTLQEDMKAKYTLIISLDSLSGSAVEHILTTPSKRHELIEEGRKCADVFMADHSIT